MQSLQKRQGTLFEKDKGKGTKKRGKMWRALVLVWTEEEHAKGQKKG